MESAAQNLHSLYLELGDLKGDFRNYNLYRFILKRLQGKSILDIGCGAGHFLHLVKEKGMTLQSDGDKLKISVADIASDEIDFAGDKFLANFQPSYLLTALNFIDSESITIEFNNDFYIQGKQDGKLFLIAPRRI